MKMELTEGSETLAYINQTPGNYPKGNLLYSVHGESLKSRIPHVKHTREQPRKETVGRGNRRNGYSGTAIIHFPEPHTMKSINTFTR